MALTQLPGTVDYLTDAAHLLRMTAPESSAHLMSHRNHLLSTHDVPQSDTQRQHVCGACGHILIPGQGSSLRLEARKTQKQKKPWKRIANKSAATPRSKVIHCGNCRRITKVSLPPAGPAMRGQAAGARKKPTAAEAEPAQPPARASANANSKKRAKNRKAGLQALLSGQKQQAGSPLSLASFMKQ